jgi:sugar/nucleoside kinase (ribokinase family)
MNIKPKENCRWDLLGLGEVMLRFDPGDRRIWTARQFEVSEGGGEYNVARGLKRCFGLDTAVVTALADNPIGRLVEDLMNQGGVDHSLTIAGELIVRTARHMVVVTLPLVCWLAAQEYPTQALLAWAVQCGTALLATRRTATRARKNLNISVPSQDAIEKINFVRLRQSLNEMVKTGIPGFVPQGR